MIGVLRGAAVGAGSLAVVTVAVAALTAALPGDAANVQAGADRGNVDALRAELGTDRPWWQRSATWIGGLVRGDLGRSYTDGADVLDVVAARAAHTMWLAVPVWLLVMGVGGAVALASGWREADSGRRTGAHVLTVIAAVPEVCVVSVVIVVGAHLLHLGPPVSLIPVSGRVADDPRILLLPVVALAVPTAAWVARLLRGPVTDACARPFVRDARLRGVPVSRCLWRHVLPHVAAPVAQVGAVVVAAVLGGSAVVEAAFGFRGLGDLLVSAVRLRDVPVIQGVALVLAVTTLLALAVADSIGTARHSAVRA